MTHKVIITGSGGFLGSHISDFYADQGWEIIGVGKCNAWAKDLFQTRGFMFLPLTLPDPRFAELVAEVQPDLIVHCAGTSTVSRSFSSPFESFLETVGSTAFVLDSVRQHSPDTHVIYLSSAAVYGNVETLPVREDTATNPISPYGHQKLMCEQMMQRYRNDYGIDTTILRIFSAYGERLKKQVLWDLCHRAVSSDEKALAVRGLPSDGRDYIHWSDLVQAVHVVERARATGIFNVASGLETTIEALACAIRDSLAPTKDVIFEGSQMRGYPSRWVADVSKLQSLGYESSVSIQSGVQQYCKWFMKETGLCFELGSPLLEVPAGQEG